MAHTFTVELTDADIAALCARFGYQTFVPDPNGKGAPNQRAAVPNPISAAKFAQMAIEAFIDRTTDEHIGQEAAKGAVQSAVEAYRAQHPRKRAR